MGKRKKQIVGKIGFCNNADLGLTDARGNPLIGGHYVYIRELNGNRCDVNIITSLEDRNGFIDMNKIKKVRKGYLYPIPKRDANFQQWSAVNLDSNIRNVKISKIRNLGIKSMKKRHRFFAGKFSK